MPKIEILIIIIIVFDVCVYKFSKGNNIYKYAMSEKPVNDQCYRMLDRYIITIITSKINYKCLKWFVKQH